MENSLKITLIVAGTVILLAVLGFFAFTGDSTSDTVSVQGTAEIESVPDLVKIYFRVETTGVTATEAKNDNSEIVDIAIKQFTDIGIDEKKISTSNFNVYQEYDWVDGQRIEKGFKASHSLEVELGEAELDKAGEVIDVGVEAGALISYVNYELELDSQNSYKAQALSAATADAKNKAEAIASGLDKQVGKLVSISDSSFNYAPWPLYGAKGDMAVAEVALAKEAVTNIQPGEQTIRATVSAVYKLK